MQHYQEWCLLSFSYLKAKDEAEDVVQDVFVKLLVRERLQEIENLKGYIHAAVRNASITKLKQLRKIKKGEWASLSVPSCETDLINTEIAADIQRKIEALPDQSKKVFKLCVIDGQKYENAADTMGISVNTVKYHLKKSFKVLRLTLRNTYFLMLLFINPILF